MMMRTGQVPTDWRKTSLPKTMRAKVPFAYLQQPRANRTTTQDAGIRRVLTFQIHRLHRVEVRKWKSRNLAQHLHIPSQWNLLRGMPLRTGSRTMSQAPVDEFANMLEVLFAGNPSDPQQPDLLTEVGWTLDELAKAIQKLKLDKAVDECGLAAEFLKHLPDFTFKSYWICIILCFAMVRCHLKLEENSVHFGKHVKAKLVSDFRPIAATPIACLAAGHRSIRQHDLHILNVEFRSLARSMWSLLAKPMA